MASILFAVALLCSGQNATLTGTLAGQIVMEGFINIRLRPWLRRLITRLIAIIPAIIVVALYGDRGTGQLLILSQVILSLQLSFAVIPLVIFTNDPLKMGPFASPWWVKAMAWPSGRQAKCSTPFTCDVNRRASPPDMGMSQIWEWSAESGARKARVRPSGEKRGEPTDFRSKVS